MKLIYLLLILVYSKAQISKNVIVDRMERALSTTKSPSKQSKQSVHSHSFENKKNDKEKPVKTYPTLDVTLLARNKTLTRGYSSPQEYVNYLFDSGPVSPNKFTEKYNQNHWTYTSLPQNLSQSFKTMRGNRSRLQLIKKGYEPSKTNSARGPVSEKVQSTPKPIESTFFSNTCNTNGRVHSSLVGRCLKQRSLEIPITELEVIRSNKTNIMKIPYTFPGTTRKHTKIMKGLEAHNLEVLSKKILEEKPTKTFPDFKRFMSRETETKRNSGTVAQEISTNKPIIDQTEKISSINTMVSVIDRPERVKTMPKFGISPAIGGKLRRSRFPSDTVVAPDYEPVNSVFSNPDISEIIADNPSQEINPKALKKFKPLITDDDNMYSRNVPFKYNEENDEEFDWYQTDDLYAPTVSEKLTGESKVGGNDETYLSTPEHQSENTEVEKQIMVLGVQHTPYYDDEYHVATNSYTDDYSTVQVQTEDYLISNNKSEEENDYFKDALTSFHDWDVFEELSTGSALNLKNTEEKDSYEINDSFTEGDLNEISADRDSMWSDLLPKNKLPHTTQTASLTTKNNWVKWSKTEEILDKSETKPEDIQKITYRKRKYKYKVEVSTSIIWDPSFFEKKDIGVSLFWPMWAFSTSPKNKDQVTTVIFHPGDTESFTPDSLLEPELTTASITSNITTEMTHSSEKDQNTLTKTSSTQGITSSKALTTHTFMDDDFENIIEGQIFETSSILKSTTSSEKKYSQGFEVQIEDKNSPDIIPRVPQTTMKKNWVNWGKSTAYFTSSTPQTTTKSSIRLSILDENLENIIEGQSHKTSTISFKTTSTEKKYSGVEEQTRKGENAPEITTIVPQLTKNVPVTLKQDLVIWRKPDGDITSSKPHTDHTIADDLENIIDGQSLKTPTISLSGTSIENKYSQGFEGLEERTEYTNPPEITPIIPQTIKTMPVTIKKIWAIWEKANVYFTHSKPPTTSSTSIDDSSKLKSTMKYPQVLRKSKTFLPEITTVPQTAQTEPITLKKNWIKWTKMKKMEEEKLFKTQDNKLITSYFTTPDKSVSFSQSSVRKEKINERIPHTTELTKDIMKVDTTKALETTENAFFSSKRFDDKGSRTTELWPLWNLIYETDHTDSGSLPPQTLFTEPIMDIALSTTELSKKEGKRKISNLPIQSNTSIRNAVVENLEKNNDNKDQDKKKSTNDIKKACTTNNIQTTTIETAPTLNVNMGLKGFRTRHPKIWPIWWSTRSSHHFIWPIWAHYISPKVTDSDEKLERSNDFPRRNESITKNLRNFYSTEKTENNLLFTTGDTEKYTEIGSINSVQPEIKTVSNDYLESGEDAVWPLWVFIDPNDFNRRFSFAFLTTKIATSQDSIKPELTSARSEIATENDRNRPKSVKTDGETFITVTETVGTSTESAETSTETFGTSIEIERATTESVGSSSETEVINTITGNSGETDFKVTDFMRSSHLGSSEGTTASTSRKVTKKGRCTCRAKTQTAAFKHTEQTKQPEKVRSEFVKHDYTPQNVTNPTSPDDEYDYTLLYPKIPDDHEEDNAYEIGRHPDYDSVFDSERAHDHPIFDEDDEYYNEVKQSKKDKSAMCARLEESCETSIIPSASLIIFIGCFQIIEWIHNW